MTPEAQGNEEEVLKARVDRLLARAHAEVAAGRAWRAKEILAGAMSEPRFVIDADFLKAYGALLDALGDRFEAGKYLFLSGSTEHEHAVAIQIYLNRTRKLPVAALISHFPGALRRQGLGHLPEPVRVYLEERGAPISLTRRRQPLVRRVPDESDGVVLGIGCLAVFLVTSLIGAVTILRWLF
jgi:hypothetical protein